MGVQPGVNPGAPSDGQMQPYAVLFSRSLSSTDGAPGTRATPATGPQGRVLCLWEPGRKTSKVVYEPINATGVRPMTARTHVDDHPQPEEPVDERPAPPTAPVPAQVPIARSAVPALGEE